MTESHPAASDDHQDEDSRGGSQPKSRPVRRLRFGFKPAKPRSIVGRGDVGGNGIIGVETKIFRDGADESAVEYAAGKLVPAFVFEGLEQTNGNARGPRKHFERNAPCLALMAQTGP